MQVLPMIESVLQHLRSIGVQPECEMGAVPSEKRLEAWQRAVELPVPDGLLQAYRELGEGFSLSWDTLGEPAEVDFDLVLVELPDLDEYAESLHEGREWRIEWDESYAFDYVDDRALALETARQMRSWLPFADIGNGSRLCIDTADPNGRVVYDQHAWFDGGTGANGLLMAASFESFLRGWAGVCFISPIDWDQALGQRGVDWSDESKFPARFRVELAT